MLSSLTMIRLGHVYDGFMVDLRADNAKLRRRAVETLDGDRRLPARTKRRMPSTAPAASSRKPRWCSAGFSRRRPSARWPRPAAISAPHSRGLN